MTKLTVDEINMVQELVEYSISRTRNVEALKRLNDFKDKLGDMLGAINNVDAPLDPEDLPDMQSVYNALQSGHKVGHRNWMTCEWIMYKEGILSDSSGRYYRRGTILMHDPDGWYLWSKPQA